MTMERRVELDKARRRWIWLEMEKTALLNGVCKDSSPSDLDIRKKIEVNSGDPQ